MRLRPGSSGRCSFELPRTGGPGSTLSCDLLPDAVSGCCSEPGASPKEALAASILGASVLGTVVPLSELRAADAHDAAAAAAVGDEDANPAAASLAPSECGSEATAAALHPAASCPCPGPSLDAGGDGSQQPVEDAVTGLGLLACEAAGLAGAAHEAAAASLGALHEWLMESLAALVQGGRSGHAACLDLALIHISEPPRLRRNSYADFCLKKKKTI